MKDIETKNRYLTVPQMSEAYPAFSQSAFRHLIFNATTNNFYKVIRRVGKRKILLSEQALHEWIESQNQEGGNR